MAPFRKLLSSRAKFTWSEEMDKAFKGSKNLIIAAIEEWVEIFDIT